MSIFLGKIAEYFLTLKLNLVDNSIFCYRPKYFKYLPVHYQIKKFANLNNLKLHLKKG